MASLGIFLGLHLFSPAPANSPNASSSRIRSTVLSYLPGLCQHEHVNQQGRIATCLGRYLVINHLLVSN